MTATPSVPHVDVLFQPFRVKSLALKNRIVMAPMTRNRATDAHVPTPLMAEYYGQRASTPGTLLITEATFIAEKVTGQRRAPGIWSEEQITAWKRVSLIILLACPCNRYDHA